jgi:hypothetical protein
VTFGRDPSELARRFGNRYSTTTTYTLWVSPVVAFPVSFLTDVSDLEAVVANQMFDRSHQERRGSHGHLFEADLGDVAARMDALNAPRLAARRGTVAGPWAIGSWAGD